MHSRHGESFEREHAGRFDVRAGLPPSVVRVVAERVAALSPGRLLEVGAGTGEIGVPLAALKAPGDYVALDRSAAMLARFHARAGGSLTLLLADAGAAWPLAAASFGAVFMARVAHLLDPAHLARELVRVVQPGGLVLIGRRQRDRDNVRAILRRQLHVLLAQRGYAPRKGGREAAALAQARCELRFKGREQLPSWDSAESAEEALTSWRDKPGLSGLDLPEPTKRELLDALRSFAAAELGPDLQKRLPGREHFVVDVLTRAPE